MNFAPCGNTKAEAKRPERDVPRAMIGGTAVVTLAYVLANVAFLRLLPVTEIARSTHVASDAARAAIGEAGGGIVAGMIWQVGVASRRPPYSFAMA